MDWRSWLTLVAAFQGFDGIVLASDSRGTIGDPRGLTAVNDSYQKMFKICEHAGVAIAGASEVAAQLISLFQADVSGSKVDGISNVMNKMRDFVRPQFNGWFEQFPMDQRPGVNFVLAGYDLSAPPTSVVYILSSQLDFAPQRCTSGYMLAGIPQYATYLVHRLYDPGMTIQNLVGLAAYIITETASQDPKVGGPVKIAKITPDDKGYQELAETAIESIIEKNENQSQRMRKYFFEGENGDVS